MFKVNPSARVIGVLFVGLLLTPFARSQTRPAQPYAGDARFGVCTHFAQGWDYQKVMPLIEQSGLGWIRDDLDWSSIEHQKGVYRIPARTLAWVRGAHAHHLKMLAILNGSSKFYADRYDPQAFAQWAAWTVNELRNDVDAVEILNEPNNFGFSQYYGGKHEGEGKSPWVSKYVILMNAAADAIKKVDPAMPVIGFGAGAPATYRELKIGASPAVDGIADHPYSNHSPPEWIPNGSASEQIKRFGFAVTDENGSFASLMQGFAHESAQYHGPTQIWLTEWGFSTYQPLAPEQFSGFTESAQAKYILRRFVQGVGLGVKVSVLYEFRDGRDPHDAEARWGLVRQDGSPKPSFDAVRNMVTALHDWRAAKPDEVGAINVFPAATWPQAKSIVAYPLIDTQGRAGAAIWATDRAGGDLQPRVADVELVWGSKVQGLAAVDTLTGKTEPVAFQRAGRRLLIRGMIMRDDPVLIEQTGAPFTADRSARDDTPKNLNLFDAGAKWSFSNGQEFPGAAGAFALSRDDDRPAGIIHYDFANGGAYVSAQTNTDIPDSAADFRIDVKSAKPLGLSIRLIDKTGQVHQFAASDDGSGAWETVRVDLSRKASEHWGGANDNRVHFPLRQISLCVAKPAGDATGSVAFSHAVVVNH